MNFIKVNTEDHITHLILDRGKSNALHLEMVEEIYEAVRQAQEDPAVEGLILTGKENFFTSGLDLITLYHYDEEQMSTFWKKFMSLIHLLTAFPKPFVSAITGHSPAGGCVMAIASDYRIMAEGEYIIGLNEVPVGIIVPESIFELYRFWIGSKHAYQFLLTGKLLKPNEALKVGLIDEVVPANQIQTTAIRQIKLLSQFEKNAWRASKLNFRKSVLDKMELNNEAIVEQVLTQWWSPKTRVVLKTIIDNLTAKKG
ncbi:enoyl-CoA hydratase/isomerase family protein [Sphingobacterium hungaricum]|uniref:Enoyl-CoA hydratase/isomerase family protein n=1 Tax=Sphingobacterium hungaricum TaxID=2082723 RepID=A0A928UTM4_9SPHI|nr:enoyl-CoA hydratase/isomerase family protein [Sphingobacterium hungaricum]MBE8713005.1 enoyl-CoA hydratase/isomerase family protein [Sphingobacterium hungaricum]